jgi:hypothetical protein
MGKILMGGYTLTEEAVQGVNFIYPVSQFMYQWFTKDNDGSTVSMAVNGSGTAQDFQLVCPADKLMIVNRVIFHLADGDISYDLEFGGLGAALGNGLLIKAHDADDSELLDYNDGVPITLTSGFFHLAASDVDIKASGKGADPDTMCIRWSLFKTGGAPYFTPGQYINIKVQDNLTGLAAFDAMAQGLLLDFD